MISDTKAWQNQKKSGSMVYMYILADILGDAGFIPSTIVEPPWPVTGGRVKPFAGVRVLLMINNPA